MRRVLSAWLFAGAIFLAANGSGLPTRRAAILSGSSKAGPITHTYTTGSSATETVPAGGYVQLIIEGYGPGGDGADKNSVSCADGGGGGGGAYFKKTYVLVSSDAGKTLTYTVGTASGTATTTTTANLANGSAVLTANSGASGSGTTGGSPRRR